MPAWFCSRAGTQLVDELVRLLADAAADDHEIGPEEGVDDVDVFGHALAPGVPAQALADPDRGRRTPLGVLAAHLQVPELGVRHEDAVAKQCRADPGPEREHEHGARLPAACA